MCELGHGRHALLVRTRQSKSIRFPTHSLPYLLRHSRSWRARWPTPNTGRPAPNTRRLCVCDRCRLANAARRRQRHGRGQPHRRELIVVITIVELLAGRRVRSEPRDERVDRVGRRPALLLRSPLGRQRSCVASPRRRHRDRAQRTVAIETIGLGRYQPH